MMLHTLTPYWETYFCNNCQASTPLEYLAGMGLFTLMVVVLDRGLGFLQARTT